MLKFSEKLINGRIPTCTIVFLILLFLAFTALLSSNYVRATTNIQVSPSGHYFTYNNETKMILADSGTQVVMQNLNIDYRGWVDKLASEGHPSAHIWAFVAPRQKLDGSVIEDRYGYVYPGITPWKRKTSGPLAYDQGYQWDLFTFDEGDDPDQQYWPRLRDLCLRLKNNNMMLGITVFFGWPKDSEDLKYHPFHVDNGGPARGRSYITFIDLPGTEIYNQNWSDSWPVRTKNQWLWEKFSLKLIETADTCGNVWFDFRDEWSYDTTTNMETHFRNFFMSRGQIWADRSSSASFRVNNPIVKSFGSTPSMKTEGAPYDNDGVRREAWNRATGGIHYLLHNDSRTPGIMVWDPNVGGDPDSDLGRKYVGYASYFFNNIVQNLDDMEPNDNLVSNGKCLANPGSEYVVWKSEGGSFSVNLSSASGSFSASWYNPKTKVLQSAGSVAGGGSRDFTSPFVGDAVLHLVKGGDSVSGDADGDVDVDIIDYAIWITQYLNYNPTPNGDPDFNNDGGVDGKDFTIWLNNYGN